MAVIILIYTALKKFALATVDVLSDAHELRMQMERDVRCTRGCID